MPATTKAPLGASTKVRKWYLDVNTGTFAAPVWVGIFGMTEFKPTVEPTLQDDSDFDSEGHKSETVTALAWACEGKVSRKTTTGDPTAYDPGQEVLRLASVEMGTENSVDVRFYEMEPDGPRIEAYRGNAAVTWSPEGGAMDALDMVSFKLSGQGKRSQIAHPDNVAESVPTITSLSPSSTPAAGGDQIVITGTGFATATDVEVDSVAVPAEDWAIIAADKIAFVSPAHAAASVDVTVTNGAGTSAPSSLTYT